LGAHELDPLLGVPTGALDRPVWLDRIARKLARREQTLQVRIAPDLAGRCRALTRAILELERELAVMTAQPAPALLELPGCGALTAAKLLAEIGPIDRFQTDAQLARHGGVAPLEASSGHVRRHGSTAAATANSTAPCTGSPSRRRASIPRLTPISSASRPKARATAKRSAASNANSRASSSTHSKRAQP